jgi:hypothetical protein
MRWTQQQYDEYLHRCARSNPVVEPNPRDVPLAAHQGKTPPAGKLHVSFISFRQRLCDPDNLSVKWLLDCLRFVGAIPGDEPDKITLEIRQEKVKSKGQEQTVIMITDQDDLTPTRFAPVRDLSE